MAGGLEGLEAQKLLNFPDFSLQAFQLTSDELAADYIEKIFIHRLRRLTQIIFYLIFYFCVGLCKPATS
jgi:hypothetical protein